MRRNGVQQLAGDFVRVGVEKTDPAQIFDPGQLFEQQGKAVFQAEIFAVAGGVLADEGDLADAALGQAFGLGDHGLEAAGAELSAQLRDDAEGAGMIAAFGDFDVGHVPRRGEDAGRGVVVKIVREIADGAVPVFAGEAALRGASVAFRARLNDTRLDHHQRGTRWCRCCDSGGGQNVFQFSGSDDRIDFGNILANLIAEALDEASGDHQFLGLARSFVAGHFEDGVHRLLLRALDERAGVDHDHVGVFGAAGEFGAGTGQKAHHDFAVDEILGAAQTDEAHLLRAFAGVGGRRLLRRSCFLELEGTANSEVLHRHAIFLF